MTRVLLGIILLGAIAVNLYSAWSLQCASRALQKVVEDYRDDYRELTVQREKISWFLSQAMKDQQRIRIYLNKKEGK